MTSKRPDLAVFVASLANGGVGKMRIHLLNEFARRGYQVDLLLADHQSRYLTKLNEAVQVHNIGTSNAITGIPALANYLLRRRPRVLLTQRVRVNALAHRTNRLLGGISPVFVTENTHQSLQLASLSPAKAARHLKLLRRYYPLNQGIIAVSRGVAVDLAKLLDWPADKITVATNPTVTSELQEQARQPLDHPWFQSGLPPVILGMGRLEPQKDFPTLLRAFAQVRRDFPARLVLLGEGKLRADLLDLARSLGIENDLDLPGFTDNPYAYLSRAKLFTLSSAWEGSPNSLVEAMALGTPVVATHCPSGPEEILEGGRYGRLVAVGDYQNLAQAMLDTLANPPVPATLIEAAQRYTVERSATAYLQALGLMH